MSDPVDTDALRATAIDLEPVRADERLSNTQWARVHIAKRALFTAADEVDRLRISDSNATQQRDQLANALRRSDNENDRLRAVIENAPHGIDCPDRFTWRDDSTLPCDCWKADVL